MSSITANPALTFYHQLEAQVSDNGDGLALDLYDCLSRYYKALKKNVSLRPFYRYNWVRRVAPLQDLLVSLPQREFPWRILDAGCGVGTESIFWAMLREDVRVVGVDANADRLHTARARLSSLPHLSTHVSFLNDDVFRVLSTQAFDVIWVMEAISHIDPAETFISQAYSSLTPQGVLIISDSNSLNPVIAWRELCLRIRGVTHNTPVRTETGAVVKAAAERYFSPGKLAHILHKNGFEIAQVRMSIFFPPALARSETLFRIAKTVDALSSKLVGVRSLGGIYTIIAKKSR